MDCRLYSSRGRLELMVSTTSKVLHSLGPLFFFCWSWTIGSQEGEIHGVRRGTAIQVWLSQIRPVLEGSVPWVLTPASSPKGIFSFSRHCIKLVDRSGIASAWPSDSFNRTCERCSWPCLVHGLVACALYWEVGDVGSNTI